MKYVIFSITITACVFAACNKMPLETPSDFQVTVPKTTFRLGDTVEFTFKGKPVYTTFYSGEPGRNFFKRDSFFATGGVPSLTIATSVTGGTASQANLSVLASNDFNGVFDQANVNAATWTNVTARAGLATTAATRTSTFTLTDIKSEGRPIYIAFRYKADSSRTGAVARQWTITSNNFIFNTVYPDGKQFRETTFLSDGAFQALSFTGDSLRWTTAGNFVFPAGRIGFPADDDWLISRAFSVNKSFQDVGVTLSNMTVALPNTYRYVFARAGTYKVVFHASDQNFSGVRSVTREIDLTITP